MENIMKMKILIAAVALTFSGAAFAARHRSARNLAGPSQLSMTPTVLQSTRV